MFHPFWGFDLVYWGFWFWGGLFYWGGVSFAGRSWIVRLMGRGALVRWRNLGEIDLPGSGGEHPL
eukprot:3195266-Amphidinium_carterae.1